MSLAWVVLVLALWVVVLALAVVVLGLLRRIGPVLEAAERTLRTVPTMPGDLGGLQPGAQVPDLHVTTVPGGARQALGDLLDGGLVVLFVQQGCPACTTLLTALAAEPGVLAGTRLLVVADPAEAAELSGLADEGLGVHVGVQHDGDVSRAFDQRAFPQAFAIDPAGIVAAQLIPSTIDDLTRLGARLRERAHAPTEPARTPTDQGGSP